MKKIGSLSLWAVALLLAGAALLLFESSLLWKVQSMNEFLGSALFFRQQMLVPGGLLSYVGSFLTQLLFHPWLGVGVLLGLWWLLMWVSARALGIEGHWRALLLLPVALLLVANVDLGYWIYVLKWRGYFFAPTLGTLVAAALLWAYRLTPRKRWLRAVVIGSTVAAGYPLLGVWALAAALLMGLADTCRSPRDFQGGRLMLPLALLMVVAVPLLYYRYVFFQTNLQDIYATGLPVFTFLDSHPVFYLPYILLAACYAGAACCRWDTKTAAGPASTTKQNGARRRQAWLRSPLLAQGLLLVALSVGVFAFWFKDENFHHELRMQHCVERLDWDGVLKEAMRQKDEPTRSIVMMRNLALARIGRQGDDMYIFPNGAKPSHAPFPILLSQIIGRMIYYHYGLPNECHRVCLEEGVENGWRTEILQYMARCALMNGEQQAARKFLQLLRQTMFYGKWADNMQPLLRDRRLLEQAAETGPVSHMMHYANTLGSDNGYTEQYVMGLLAAQDSDDKLFQEQALLATLWKKDAQLFWPRFIGYARQHPHDRIPRYYQEAAYLFGTLENHPNLSKIPFSDGIKQSFQAFVEAMKRCDGLPMEEARKRLYPVFGSTYYYEYYMMSDLKYF